MAILNTTISISGDDIFICPGTLVSDEQEHAVTCIIICNITASDTTLNLHIVPQGSIVGNSNKIINLITIPAQETFTLDTEKLILDTGDKIHAVPGDNNALVATVSSVRVS